MTIFPNVPNVPGVPPVPRQIGAIEGGVAGLVLLTQDIASFFAGTLAPQWGIYQNNVPVVQADNVISIDYKQDWTVSDYPIEPNAFQSYDKVQLPFECRIRFSKGGSVSDRQNFLNSIAAIASTLNLYDILTPEAMYPSVNITHYDYHRVSNSGVGLMIVDVWAIQVRIVNTATFSDVVNPASASPKSGGQVTGIPPSSGIASMFQAGGFSH
jgi:hypothetical protein